MHLILNWNHVYGVCGGVTTPNIKGTKSFIGLDYML